MNKLAFLSALLMSASSVFAQSGDRKGHNMVDLIPKDKVPPAPVLSVDKALKSFKLQNGFVLESVVNEPQVANPVTMTFDGNGRMWICEMLSYMPNVDGKNEEVPEGKITVLEDTNGDGKADKRTEFVTGVILPRTITLVKGGILYADHTKLYFAEVLPGLKKGKVEVADATYAKGGSLEHKPNTMLYGLDNWYYNSKSSKRYKCIPLDQEAPLGSTVIYKNKYFQLCQGTSEGRGQWGLSMDDYGRLYHNGNSSPATGEYLRPNSLLRNPGYKAKGKSFRIGPGEVYPSRMNPGINRGYMKGMLKDVDKPDSPSYGYLAKFTAASGNTVYRGTNFPEKFYGSSWTPEPAANLLSVRKITEKDGSLGGSPLYQKSEVLTSSDERFRPVNLYTAPDGSLYIVDLYHGILQHRVFVTSYLRKHILDRDLDKNNNGIGRIYRLRYEGGKLQALPKMEGLSAAKLVPHLANGNGWWRDTARRLIVEQNDKSVAPAIIKLLASKDHRVVINALWTLEGLRAVSMNAVTAALANGHVKATVNALAVSESLPISEHAAMTKVLEKLAGENNYEIALQIALTGGMIRTPEALQVLKKVLTSKNGGKSFVKEAVISGLYGRENDFKAILGDYKDKKFLSMLNSVGKKIKVATNYSKLSKADQKVFNKGKDLYFGVATCFACHGADAMGMPNIGPPIAKSEWVNGSKEKLLSILLKGLSGPITVAGKKYNPPLPMPGLGANPMFKDADLAAIATYIRNHYGNKASVVSASDVAAVRKATASRGIPFTAKDLENK